MDASPEDGESNEATAEDNTVSKEGDSGEEAASAEQDGVEQTSAEEPTTGEDDGTKSEEGKVRGPKTLIIKGQSPNTTIYNY